ncbi:MAG: hypothetical protein KAI35_01810 [Desulfobulbaceae bacterium]|nr:hypothetical protein [Desulfobulbaceae bacterium]
MNTAKKSGHKTWAQTAALGSFLFFTTSIFSGCVTTQPANDVKSQDNQKIPNSAEETTGEMPEVTVYRNSEGIGTLKDDHQKTAALYNRDSRRVGSADIEGIEGSGNAQTMGDIAKEAERRERNRVNIASESEKNVVLRTIDTISDGVIIGVNTVIVKPLGVAKKYVIDKPIDFLQKNVIYRGEVKDSGQKPQDPAGES